jgi:hypothetical protein
MTAPRAVAALIALSFLTACGTRSGHDGGPIVARMGDRTLAAADVDAMIPATASAQDSATMAQAIIRNWVVQNLMLEKAELNLSEEALDVERRLEEYRRSLITYAYQEELVRQKLDTIVPDTLIERYYKENSQNFELSENIVRAIMIKWPKKDRDTDKVRKWMRSTDEGERQMLIDLCNQRALMMHLDDQTWLKVDELLGKLPKLPQLDAEYLNTHRSSALEMEDGVLLIEVLEAKYGKSVAPLEFERDNIRHIILNKRKLELIRQLEKGIFDEAVAKNKFEIIPQ